MHSKDALPQLLRAMHPMAEDWPVRELLRYCVEDLALSPRESERVLNRVLDLVRALNVLRGPAVSEYDSEWERTRPDPRQEFRPRNPSADLESASPSA